MTRLKTLISISIIVLIYAFYYWAIPLIVNIESKSELIKAVVKKELGADVKLEKPKLKMGLTPSIWIEADTFSFIDENTEPFIVKNPKIKIKLLPLLWGKIELSYISCDKIFADLMIDKNFRIYIGKYLVIKSSDPKVSIDNAKVNIENYKIKLKDNTEDKNKNISINGDYFYVEKYNSKDRIKFLTDSTIKINQNVSKITAKVDFKLPLKETFKTNEVIFDGTITNLNLEDLSPYIRRVTKGQITKTQGILSIHADTKDLNRKTTQILTQAAIKDLLIKGKESYATIELKEKLNIDSSLMISRGNLKIEEFSLKSGRMDLNIYGEINKLNSNNPDVNVCTKVGKSRIEDYIALLPAQNIEGVDINFVALKKYGYYSDIWGEVCVKGKGDKPKLIGQIVSKDGYVIKPLPDDTKKADVIIDFLGEKIGLDVKVPVNGNETVFVKGDFELYNKKDANLDISSTQNVDLARTESILNPVHEVFQFEIGPVPVMELDGSGNITLKIRGNKQTPMLNGAFNFKNTTAKFNDVNMKIKDGEGTLYFKEDQTHFITRKATLDSRPVKIDGTCSMKGVLDFDITANGQSLNYLNSILQTSKMFEVIKKDIPNIKMASGNINALINLSGKVKNLNDFSLGKTVFISGKISLLGNGLLIENIPVEIKNLFGDIQLKNNDATFDLYSKMEKSKLDVKGKVKQGVLSFKAKLDDVLFQYSGIPIKIYSGVLELNNNKLSAYKINALADSMPILIDGTIANIFKASEFDLYINSKPTQKFIEKYINKTSTYPLKIKGDIIYTARIKGQKDKLNARAEINMEADSNIYYMGATLGDANNAIRIYLDTVLFPNEINVNNFQYDKLITSQNDKEFVSSQLKARGKINYNKQDINFNNFKIITANPTDAKIFNILFKKPIVKQGLFNSNLEINGSINRPKLLGMLNFTGIDIPVLDTTIKDISLDFKDKDIDIKAKGEVFSNQIILLANMYNKLNAPFIFNQMDIYLGNLDINEIAKTINKLEINSEFNSLSQTTESSAFNITNVMIKKGKLKADSVFVRNIFAKNLIADFALSEKLLFTLDNFKFEVAQGNVNGEFKYNLLNSNSTLDLHVNDINANAISEALFDLQNQIFGSLTGQVLLTCNAKTHKTCMNTLSGNGGFRVANGKMPKLGSMEYLLKAANLVKSGLTGVTINGIIDLITPLKTGEFESINGMFEIKSGLADSIQIFSKGKDLSLFLTGTYNFTTLMADMKVFGRISKKISGVLGPVGNTSLNTLFNTIPGLNLEEAEKKDFIKGINKIPGIELNDKTYRIFSAEIYGDINGDNYVQSFKWVE